MKFLENIERSENPHWSAMSDNFLLDYDNIREADFSKRSLVIYWNNDSPITLINILWKWNFEKLECEDNSSSENGFSKFLSI